MKKADAETASPEAPKPPKATKKETPVRISLLDGKKGEAEGTDDASTRPFTVVEGTGTSLSLGVFADDMEFIWPWIGFVQAARKGEQMDLQVGDWKITLMMNAKKASENGWQLQQIVEGIHAQTISWLRTDEALGLTIEVEPIKKDQ